MKMEIIKILKILGVGCTEVLVDIELNEFLINSIELLNDDQIILHVFVENYDIELYFDELDEIEKMNIYQILISLLYN